MWFLFDIWGLDFRAGHVEKDMKEVSMTEHYLRKSWGVHKKSCDYYLLLKLGINLR